MKIYKNTSWFQIKCTNIETSAGSSIFLSIIILDIGKLLVHFNQLKTVGAFAGHHTILGGALGQPALALVAQKTE